MTSFIFSEVKLLSFDFSSCLHTTLRHRVTACWFRISIKKSQAQIHHYKYYYFDVVTTTASAGDDDDHVPLSRPSDFFFSILNHCTSWTQFGTATTFDHDGHVRRRAVLVRVEERTWPTRGAWSPRTDTQPPRPTRSCRLWRSFRGRCSSPVYRGIDTSSFASVTTF